MDTLNREYERILNLQKFNPDLLDYRVFEHHLPALTTLAQMNNCGITVFDLFKKEHIFISYNFSELLGYDLDAAQQYGSAYFNSRVHPDDLHEMYIRGNALLGYIFQHLLDKIRSWKLVNQYRVLGKDNTYIRVIEQQQALELDASGNLWLALGVIDIAPDQSADARNVISQIYDFKTGQILPWPIADIPDDHVVLSKREIEILQYIKLGFLSKEISEKLYISLNTVNTHRQRILRKLGATNSHEAMELASKMGII